MNRQQQEQQEGRQKKMEEEKMAEEKMEKEKLNPLLNIYKTTVTHLISFEVLSIRIIPYLLATIDIKILTNTEHLYRTVTLRGDDYSNWGGDDIYIYEYIKNNIESIY